MSDADATLAKQSETAQVRFRKPPIIERVATVSGNISPEQFHSRMDSWKSIVAADFPIYDPLTEWLLNVQEKDGVPLLDEAEPEVVVTHRFSRRNQNGDRTWSMRCPADRLTLNLHSEHNEPHNFEELFAAMAKWLPRWSDHFGATAYPTVQLDYVNLLGPQTTPTFVDRNGGIQINRLIEVFGKIPGPHISIIAPYDCRVGLLIEPNRCMVNIHVHAVRDRDAALHVRVDLQVIATQRDPLTSADAAMGEVRYTHDVLIGQFLAIFTEEAKTSFEPL
jgi:hypothetical protein